MNSGPHPPCSSQSLVPIPLATYLPALRSARHTATKPYNSHLLEPTYHCPMIRCHSCLARPQLWGMPLLHSVLLLGTSCLLGNVTIYGLMTTELCLLMLPGSLWLPSNPFDSPVLVCDSAPQVSPLFPFHSSGGNGMLRSFLFKKQQPTNQPTNQKPFMFLYHL